MQYMGGKQRISKDLCKFLNSQLTTSQPFVDLFCGSCNVVSKIDPNHARYANDYNSFLPAMWGELQNGWKPPVSLTESEYKEILNMTPVSTEDIALKCFVGFGCAFAGKWLGSFARNKRGDDYCKAAFNSTMKKAALMKDVVFSGKSYEDFDIPLGALVYCDIPYKNTTQYSATGAFDHEAFYLWLKSQSKVNRVLVSEYGHNVPDFCKIVWMHESKQDMRSKDGSKKKTIEVIYEVK